MCQRPALIAGRKSAPLTLIPAILYRGGKRTKGRVSPALDSPNDRRVLRRYDHDTSNTPDIQLIKKAGPAGLEPATRTLRRTRSIQLSYGPVDDNRDINRSPSKLQVRRWGRNERKALHSLWTHDTVHES